jgi:thioredoxin 1
MEKPEPWPWVSARVMLGGWIFLVMPWFYQRLTKKAIGDFPRHVNQALKRGLIALLRFTERPISMTSAFGYASATLSREAINALSGAALLELGTDWCGFCLARAPIVTKALAAHPAVLHLKVEDGPGRALGRSFQVKRWPTLIFQANGQEVARLVRSTDGNAVAQALDAIDPRDAAV